MPDKKFCVECGSPNNGFRSPHALKCVKCDAKTAETRKEYHRQYHQARSAAVRDLIQENPDRFDELLERRRVQVERKERKAKAS